MNPFLYAYLYEVAFANARPAKPKKILIIVVAIALNSAETVALTNPNATQF